MRLSRLLRRLNRPKMEWENLLRVGTNYAVGWRVTDAPDKWANRFLGFKSGHRSDVRGGTLVLSEAVFELVGNLSLDPSRTGIAGALSSGDTHANPRSVLYRSGSRIAQQTDVRWCPDILHKEPHSPLHTMGSAAERQATVQGIYQCQSLSNLDMDTLIVLDDFITVGDTLSEIGRAVHENNPSVKVIGLALGQHESTDWAQRKGLDVSNSHIPSAWDILWQTGEGTPALELRQKTRQARAEAQRKDEDKEALAEAQRQARAEKRKREIPDWEQAERAWDKDEICTVSVVDASDRGLKVHFGQVLECNISYSELQEFHKLEPKRQESLANQYVSEERTLHVRVLDFDPIKGLLWLSEKAATGELRKKEFLDSLEEGQTRDGVVTNLTHFGAFVNLGELDGLIHISELALHRVEHPSEVLKVDDVVTVKTISVDRERERIGLSLRQLLPDPWATVEDRYNVGDLVEVKITNIKDFGAFARPVNDQVDGLIHISELSLEHIERVKDAVRIGEIYEVKIINLNVRDRRMGLSIKQACLDWDIAPDASGAS